MLAAAAQVRGPHLPSLRRQLHRHEHRLPRVHERQRVDNQSQRDINEILRMVAGRAQERLRDSRRRSPTTTCRAQPTLWEVYGIQKGGNEFFIQFTTDSVVWWEIVLGATPSEAVSWGKVECQRAPTRWSPTWIRPSPPALLRIRGRCAPFGRRPRRNLLARRGRSCWRPARGGHDGGGLAAGGGRDRDHRRPGRKP